MKRWLAVLVVAAGAGLALAVFLRARGPSAPAQGVAVPCTVTVADPASGLAAVRMEFGEEALAGRRDLLLAFADVAGGRQMLRTFAAELDGQPIVPSLATYRGALVRRIELARSSRRLVVSYTIDPTYYPPGHESGDPADARSRITAGFGVVRSTSLLPVIAPAGVVLHVAFDLPAGWQAVTPWPSEDGRVVVPGDATTPVEYLAIGPVETREFPVGGSTVRVVVPIPFEGDRPPVEDIVRREIELVAAPFPQPGLYVATIVPEDFMRGGAAGSRTIVQSPEPEVIAHEVFHWWNGGTLTAPDAGWFREGLTEYYGIRVARETGAWTDAQEGACLADLNGEMRFLERTGSQSLSVASSDPRMSRLVYSKGALFWLLAARRLGSAGRFLEEAVRRVMTGDRHRLTTADLRSLFSSVYGGLLDEDFDRYVIGAQPLPDLELGPATGRSGCAPGLPPIGS